MKKNNLLTIGELSKLTDASIYSLRYYEKIGAFEPAFIDDETGYRYYALEQVFHVQLIMFCIELDIPLKELIQFTDDNKRIDYLALLSHGKGIAKQKLQKIQKGLRFIESTEQKIVKSKTLNPNQKIYSRELPQKYLHVIPYNKPFGGTNQFEEVARAFLNFEYSEDEDYSEFSEFGLLYEQTPTGVQRYIFVELAKRKKAANVKIVPAGTYQCLQSGQIEIEKTAQNFSDYLKRADSYIAIETAFFDGIYEINKPVTELRVLAQEVT